MDIYSLIVAVADAVWGWPLIFFVVGASLFFTIVTGYVQFRFFGYAWRLTLKREMHKTKGDMSPLEALINALSVSLGNGSIAGVATAIASGGPGAAFWIFILGILGMALRFVEVFIGTAFPSKHLGDMTLGGPVIYLAELPGGRWWAKLYAFFLVLLGLAASAGMQSNSICLGCVYLFGVSPLVIAVALFIFVVAVISGSARRIVLVADALVPIKVILFFSTAIIVLAYHWASLIPALKLIAQCAFAGKAVAGGCLGFTVQQAMRYGFARTINASEAGLGSAAVLFGGTDVHKPFKNGVLSMLSVFISTNLVCFMVALMIIASGVSESGATSLGLTIQAYETVFGYAGGIIVTFLSLTFGLGVLVSYSYIATNCWLFFTDGKYERFFKALFCLAAFGGALGKVEIVWTLTDLVNAALLVLNLIGLLWLTTFLKNEIAHKQA